MTSKLGEVAVKAKIGLDDEVSAWPEGVKLSVYNAVLVHLKLVTWPLNQVLDVCPWDPINNSFELLLIASGYATEATDLPLRYILIVPLFLTIAKWIHLSKNFAGVKFTEVLTAPFAQ